MSLPKYDAPLITILERDSRSYYYLWVAAAPLMVMLPAFRQISYLAYFIAVQRSWIFLLIALVLTAIAKLQVHDIKPALSSLPERLEAISPRTMARFVFVAMLMIYLGYNCSLPSRGITVTGDEPHYLLIAESLISDLDLDHSDEYEQQIYKQWDIDLLPPHVYWIAERLVPVHHIGLPLLLSIPYALLGVSGARLLLIVISALVACNMYLFARSITGRSASALIGTIIASTTLPLLTICNQIYPDVVATLITIYTLRIAYLKKASNMQLIMAIAGLCFLPWLHVKYLAHALILFINMIFLQPRRLIAGGLFVPMFAASLGAMLLYFKRIYFNWLPSAQYGTIPLEVKNLARGLLGNFFDQEGGLFILSPIYVLSVIGMVHLIRKLRLKAIPVLLTIALVLLVMCSYGMWWGGWTPPNRFIMPIIPLFAVMLCLALDAIKILSFRLWIFWLSLCSYIVVLTLLRYPAATWINGFGHGNTYLRWISTAADMTRYLPSYTIWEQTRATYVITAVIALAVIAFTLRYQLTKHIAGNNQQAELSRLGLKQVAAVALFLLVYSGIVERTVPSKHCQTLDGNNQRMLWAINRLSTATVPVGGMVWDGVGTMDISGMKVVPLTLEYPCAEMHHYQGTIIDDNLSISKKVLYGDPLEDKLGFLSYGPYETLPAGDYQVTFILRADRAENDNLPSDETVAAIEVAVDRTGSFFVRRELTMADFPQPDRYYRFTQRFSLPHQVKEVELRVGYYALAHVYADRIMLTYYFRQRSIF